MSKKYKLDKIALHAKIGLEKRDQDRLSGKKVMLPITKDNNRYTHTMDVNKVATEIYKKLKNSPTKDEFIKNLQKTKLHTMCSWHDIGHCPYGHAGEDALNALISEDEEEYRDSFYSGYKHNLLSAKILLDRKENVSWDIIDGVIKHSKTYPGNFNVSRVSDNNILKLNYIFNCDKTRVTYNAKGELLYANESWYNFVKKLTKKFPCNFCSLDKYSLNLINNIKISSEGKKGGCEYCVKKETFNKNNIKENITQYLLFPHPLTVEGAILKIADEISGLARDIQGYFGDLQKEKKDTKYQIVKAKVENALNIQKIIFRENGNMNAVTLIGKVETLIHNPSHDNAEGIIKYLIENLAYSSENFQEVNESNYNKKSIIVNWHCKETKDYCLPLIDFNKDIHPAFEKIKKCIYGIIHKDRAISQDNKKGENKIKDIFNYYYKTPREFFNIKENLRKELNEITEIIYNMPFGDVVEKIEYAKAHCKDGKDEKLENNYMKLLNSFRREIAFYIAEMTEAEIESL